MKQEIICPFCGSVWSISEIDLQSCENCNYPDNPEENDFEYQKPQRVRPESYFFNKREPNGDQISDYEI